MDFLKALEISGSALTAERTRMNIAAMNMANANTTRTLEGGPYRAKSVVFESRELEDFSGHLDAASRQLRKVEVSAVVEDQAPFKEVYDPSHPDADENGLVLMPNVNVVEQMVDMMNARRSYEANVTSLDAVKRMALKALEIGE